jgi:hypothetical protein
LLEAGEELATNAALVDADFPNGHSNLNEHNNLTVQIAAMARSPATHRGSSSAQHI